MSKTLFYIVIGTITLCFMAFDNRAPILTENSWKYLNAGFNGNSEGSGTLIYGFFAARTSWGRSLWFTLLTQSLFLSGIVYLYYKYFCKSRHKLLYFLANIFLITFTMSGSLMASSISPSIFTYIGVLSVGILLFANNLEQFDRFVAHVLLIFSLLINDFTLIFISSTVIVSIIIQYFHRPTDESKARNHLSSAILLISIAICATISINSNKKISSESDPINIVVPDVESTNILPNSKTKYSKFGTYVGSALKKGFTLQAHTKLFTIAEIKEIRQWFTNDFRELSLASQIAKPLDMRYQSILQIGISVIISFFLMRRWKKGNLEDNKLILFFITISFINVTMCFIWPEISPDIQSSSLFIFSIPLLLSISKKSIKLNL